MSHAAPQHVRLEAQQIIDAEGTVQRVVDKARRARLSAIWVKIADGASAYSNVTGGMAANFTNLVSRCHAVGIEVWAGRSHTVRQ